MDTPNHQAHLMCLESISWCVVEWVGRRPIAPSEMWSTHPWFPACLVQLALTLPQQEALCALCVQLVCIPLPLLQRQLAHAHSVLLALMAQALVHPQQQAVPTVALACIPLLLVLLAMLLV